MAQGLTCLPPARQSKPYITNGVNSEFVESWLPVPEFQPTVAQAFDQDQFSPAAPTLRGPPEGLLRDGVPATPSKVWGCW